MSLFELLILLVVAGLAGGLARSLTGYSHGGCLASIALGFVGAVLGTWLARTLKLPLMFTVHVGATVFPLVWAIIGAALFVTILALVQPKR